METIRDFDQTAGYHADGEPWIADDPSVCWPEPNHLNPQTIVGEIIFTGQIRLKTVGEPKKLAKQPRRLTIILGSDQNSTDTKAYPMQNSRFDTPQQQIPISQSGEIIGFRHEARSLTGTALHQKHTLAQWKTTQAEDAIASERQLGINEGWFSPTTRDIYRHQRDLMEKQEAIKNTPRPASSDGIKF